MVVVLNSKQKLLGFSAFFFLAKNKKRYEIGYRGC
eukprot:SAG11_NODE_1164_length_5623_cov_18.626358_4_plen_35_part_00